MFVDDLLGHDVHWDKQIQSAILATGTFCNHLCTISGHLHCTCICVLPESQNDSPYKPQRIHQTCKHQRRRSPFSKGDVRFYQACIASQTSLIHKVDLLIDSQHTDISFSQDVTARAGPTRGLRPCFCLNQIFHYSIWMT